MQLLLRISFFFGLCHGLQLNASRFAHSLHEDPVIMLTSGVSGAKEMCLSAHGADLALESCMNAIAAGDGREIWAFQSGGQLLNVASNRCLGSGSLAAGGSVELVECSSAPKVELKANGQLKLGSVCLSQHGSTVGAMNVAENAGASASSSASDSGHSPSAALDQNEASFWASGYDEAGPVEFEVDLGMQESLDSVSIKWEYPARSFSVALSVDGVHWTQVFDTTVNAVSSTYVPLGGKLASKLKIVMSESHSMHGKLDGHTVFGIRTIAISAAKMHAILEDCSVAAQSADARDKYFPVSVSDYSPQHSSALKAGMPSLDAAIASLSSTVNELAAIIPKLAACQSKGASFASQVKPSASVLIKAIGARPLDQEVEKTARDLLSTASSIVEEVVATLQ